MKTKFDVGNQVNVVGTVESITIDENGAWYEVSLEMCNGRRTLTFREDMLSPIKGAKNNGSEA